MAHAHQPLRLSEIIQATQSNTASITRILHTLTHLGFVKRDRHRRYHLTPKVLGLGYAGVTALGWRQVAHHFLEQLSASIRETVNMSVLEGTDILYIARINQGPFLPFDLQLGSKLPVYCTSMGKAMLAFSPKEVIERILDDTEFRALTHRTITSKKKYLQELDKVRKQGYAINDEELSVGLRSVAAPVKDQQGWAMAALNIAVPTRRYSRPQVEKKLAPLVISTAREIEEAIWAMDV